MFTNLYNASAKAYVTAIDLRKQLERGDADSSGSTLRTAGVVVLVLAVVAAIGAAVAIAAGQVVAIIGTNQTAPTIP
jgi:membrane protein YqaA with SNARE-associated domain